MKLDSNEQKHGYAWFFTTGTVAIVLAITLYSVDNRLSQSTGEKEKGKLIGDVRRAQTGLGSRVSDDREQQSGVYSLRVEHNQAPVEESHDDAHVETHHGE